MKFYHSNFVCGDMWRIIPLLYVVIYGVIHSTANQALDKYHCVHSHCAVDFLKRETTKTKQLLSINV